MYFTKNYKFKFRKYCLFQKLANHDKSDVKNVIKNNYDNKFYKLVKLYINKLIFS